MRRKPRLFIDMDGVVAKWHPESSLEEINKPGYFKNLDPVVEVCKAVNRITRLCDIDVYILSHVMSKNAEQEKIFWCSYWLPAVNSNNLIFVPYGEEKRNYIEDFSEKDILIDDFTKNLNEWPGIGIKMLNEFNNSHKSWKGYVVNGLSSADVIFKTICGIVDMEVGA